MMSLSSSGLNDVLALLRGLSRISSAALETRLHEFGQQWAVSSLRPLVHKNVASVQETATWLVSNPVEAKTEFTKQVSEIGSRISMVVHGLRAYTSVLSDTEYKDGNGFAGSLDDTSIISYSVFEDDYGLGHEKEILKKFDSVSFPGSAINTKEVNEDIKLEINNHLHKYDTLLDYESNDIILDNYTEAIDKKLEELTGIEVQKDTEIFPEIIGNISKADTNKSVTEFDSLEYGFISPNSEKSQIEHKKYSHLSISEVTKPKDLSPMHSKNNTAFRSVKPLAKEKPKSMLADDAQARKVPDSRIGRIMRFGELAAGLGIGAVAEMTRRTFGLKRDEDKSALLNTSFLMSEPNVRRIVDTLCRVRGAALKVGQMLSIQDNTMINPQVQKIFERVRQSADFMPYWQLERTLIGQFGEQWRDKLAYFDETPFAAASIGQVHLATTLDNCSVAMKIQYPGVSKGINSDINNLVATLKMTNIFPEGMFIDSFIKVAKKELAWECDYTREAKCAKHFIHLLEDYPEYYVPQVIDDLSTSQIFTSELIEGVPVDKCLSMDQETRNYICKLIMKLSLMEVFKFGFMQTDPNWSNFYYNSETKQVALLDFGASRGYSKEFVNKYINIIHGASIGDKEKVLHYSRESGFLTGYESKVMESAHIDTVMILGEAFQSDVPFNFCSQDATRRIHKLIPVMLSHRMCPPPQESYSLHRKMSGVFLLCAKLGAILNCKPVFDEIWNNYNFGGTFEGCIE